MGVVLSDLCNEQWLVYFMILSIGADDPFVKYEKLVIVHSLKL